MKKDWRTSANEISKSLNATDKIYKVFHDLVRLTKQCLESLLKNKANPNVKTSEEKRVETRIVVLKIVLGSSITYIEVDERVD